MKRPSTKLIVFSVTVVGIAVLVASGFALKRPILKQWYIWKLESQWKEERWAAARELGKLGSSAAEDWYGSKLRSVDEEGRKAAAEQLGELGSEGAVDLLIELLRGEYSRPFYKERSDLISRRQHSSVTALARIGSSAVPAISEVLADGNPRVRQAAAVTLREIGPAAKDAVPALSVLLKVRVVGSASYLWSDAVRMAAIEALGSIGPGAVGAVPALSETLKDRWHDLARRKAVEALRKIGSAEAVPALIRALADKDEVRRLAAFALGTIGQAAIPALIERLKDKTSGRAGAAHALTQIGPAAKAAVPALVGVLKDVDTFASRAASGALVRIGLPAVPALIETLKDEDKTVRMYAASAIGEIGPVAEAAVPVLAEALKDDDQGVRTTAAYALGHIGSITAVQTLRTALQDENEWVRKAAADALKKIRGEISR